MHRRFLLLALLAPLSALACDTTKSATSVAPTTKAAPSETEAVAQRADEVQVSSASLGKPAPDFELADLDGKKIKLSDFKGKVVVLEWFNPGCPYVEASHTKGSLVNTATRHAKEGAVWLAINSGAPGKQGTGVEKNREATKEFGLSYPILLDESGKVGRSYGAERTPHIFIVDKTGTLVYRGAIDNSPDGEGQSPTGDRLINYVDETLAKLEKGEPVATPETKAYGCSVKYGSS